jgi:hypothetical protein
LSLAARNNDPPWFAFATGALILLGGILFAVAVET